MSRSLPLARCVVFDVDGVDEIGGVIDGTRTRFLRGHNPVPRLLRLRSTLRERATIPQPPP